MHVCVVLVVVGGGWWVVAVADGSSADVFLIDWGSAHCKGLKSSHLQSVRDQNFFSIVFHTLSLSLCVVGV